MLVRQDPGGDATGVLCSRLVRWVRCSQLAVVEKLHLARAQATDDRPPLAGIARQQLRGVDGLEAVGRQAPAIGVVEGLDLALGRGLRPRRPLEDLLLDRADT